MDPEDSFHVDKSRFNADLATLMNEAAAAARSHKKREPPSPQQASAKRVKNTSHRDCDSGSLEIARSSPASGTRHCSIVDPRAAQDAALFAESGTSNTLSDAVKRQLDSREDNSSYDALLERRRAEQVPNVDRYVPQPDQLVRGGPSTTSSHKTPKPFGFDALPKELQKRILGLVLIRRDGPILLDHTWLRPFIEGRSRIPSAFRPLRTEEGVMHKVPKDWNTLLDEVKAMQHDCAKSRVALERHGVRTRQVKAPCRGLTTGALKVSQAVHALAAPIFYGSNVFEFPSATSAWMQLESFLATIGPQNVAHVRSICVHAPLWFKGIEEDFVEGAILDLTSPASRLGVMQPIARDRLLSAIQTSVRMLLHAGALTSFNIEMEHGMDTDRWTGRYINTRQLIPLADAEETVLRKQQGCALLGRLTEMLGNDVPVLTLHHPPSSSQVLAHDISDFRLRLPGVIKEASKYGWEVHQSLLGHRW